MVLNTEQTEMTVN